MMRTTQSLMTWMVAGILVALSVSVRAQSQGPGDPPPPPDRPDRQDRWSPSDMPMMMHMPMEKGAFLGVATLPADATLSQQLGLPRGVGLAVAEVVPDSPAAKAGLERHDVLVKLDDQWLVDQYQLAVLVRMHKPGDSVDLTIKHQGKDVTLKATLVEHELPPLESMMGGGPGMMMPDRGPWMDRMRQQMRGPRHDSMQDLPGGMRGPQGPAGQGPPDQNGGQGGRRMGMMGGAMGMNGGMGMMGGGGGMMMQGGNSPMAAGSSVSVSQFDKDMQITVKTDSSGRTLLAKDASGKVLFDGPINTPQECQAVPPQVMQRAQKLLRMPVRILGPRPMEGRPTTQPAGPPPGPGAPGSV